MAEFGALLKTAREDRGMTLRQIATSTKISMVALEALEREDFSRLPGGIFSRAFVRAYALEVGLDPDQTVAMFIEEYDKAASMRAERAPRPEVTADDREFLERQRRAGRILRVVLIALVLIAAGAFILWQARASWQARSTLPKRDTGGGSRPCCTARRRRPCRNRPRPLHRCPPAHCPPVLVAHPRRRPRTRRRRRPTRSRCVEVTGLLGPCPRRWRRGVRRNHAHGDNRDFKPGREVVFDVKRRRALDREWAARNLEKPGRPAQPLTKATLAQYVQ